MQEWSDVTWLQLTGPGAEDFLQGYLTCDSRRINAKVATPMALCTLKGRVLASGWAVAHDGGVALIVHASLAARVAEFLKPYVTFSKCSMSVANGAVLVAADGDFQLFDDVSAALSVDSPEISTAEAATLSATLQKQLIDARFALVAAPVSEQFLPQMLGLDTAGAVDFDKGCYLGQEIVARAQHRGEVKRRLVTFTFEGPPPTVGEGYESLDCVIAVNPDGQGLAVSRV